MYIDVPRTGTNRLMISTNTGSFARKWKIRVSQIECSSKYRAPTGCLQYYREEMGKISSFNAKGKVHLVNQEYSICIEPATGMCSITYSQGTDGFFSVSGSNDLSKVGNKKCYDTPNKHEQDQVNIPGGSSDGSLLSTQALYCGGALCTTNLQSACPVKTQLKPFQVYVDFDDVEASTAEKGEGFILDYQQSKC